MLADNAFEILFMKKISRKINKKVISESVRKYTLQNENVMELAIRK